MKIYYEEDANLKLLEGKNITVVGYGSQGHAHALNLTDSGLNVTVGEMKGSAAWKRAERAGFTVKETKEACKDADLIMLLVPDEMQADIYKNEIAPVIKDGASLFFAHGFNIHYGQIVPPKTVNICMCAPKGPGHMLRQEYEKGQGIPMLIAIEQDATENAKEIALAYAKGVGGTRAGVIETTFKEETETDLFGEQVVLCGGVTSLMVAAWETLVEAGYSPEMAYFECLHELKLIVDLVYQGGLADMRYSISNTAEYGDYTRGPRIITDDTRKEMKKILSEIQSGSFAKEWILENKINRPTFNAFRKNAQSHPVEEVGKRLRQMMPWLSEQKAIKEDKE